MVGTTKTEILECDSISRDHSVDILPFTLAQVEAKPFPGNSPTFILPAAPIEIEKYLYMQPGKIYFYLLAVSAFGCLLCGLVFFIARHPIFSLFVPYLALLVAYFGSSYIVGCCSRSFSLKQHEDQKAACPLEWQPSVDIFLPNCGEDIEILENTFRHVAAVAWPNVAIHVLDDRGRDEVKELSAKYEFNYISRPNRGELKKAGNLRYAFARTNAEFIAIFDADFAARSDFLTEMMPYFYHDPLVAIVQSPQFFYLPDSLGKA